MQPFAKLEGYELILGSSIDPQLGPVLLFGTGGQLVEVWKDRALALPPLTATLASTFDLLTSCTYIAPGTGSSSRHPSATVAV